MHHHRHRHRHRTRAFNKRSSANIINKTLNRTVSVAKTASKKYMPKVESSLENVGSNVVNATQQGVPYLQRMTRKFFGMFSGKTIKHKKH